MCGHIINVVQFMWTTSIEVWLVSPKAKMTQESHVRAADEDVAPPIMKRVRFTTTTNANEAIQLAIGTSVVQIADAKAPLSLKSCG